MRLRMSIAALVFLSSLNSSMPAQQPPGTSETNENPQFADEALNAGNALMGKNKYCKALTRYQKGLTSSPEDISLLFNGGAASLEDGTTAARGFLTTWLIDQ